MNGSMSSFLTFSCGQTRKHSLEEEGILPSRGPRRLSSEPQCRAGAGGCLLLGPMLPSLSSLLAFLIRAGSWSWLCLTCHFSILLACSIFFRQLSFQIHIYSQYFYCFLLFSSPVFSLCLSSSFFPISHFHLLTSKEQKQL